VRNVNLSLFHSCKNAPPCNASYANP
jgi:hypothetical protein